MKAFKEINNHYEGTSNIHNHVFSVILPTYYRPALLKEAVNALLRQTYRDLEIILINNGATPETIEYLHKVESQDNRIKLIHFKENQYSKNDPMKYIYVCANAGLRVATGDYVFFQNDDDMIADNYVEKMVALFKENPDCTTAAGLPVSIDINGNVIASEVRKKNFRPRHIPGHQLALDALRGGKMFSAPGTIFTIKREVLIKAGGYHSCIESSHLYGIVPFGVTGFDETAILYWRRHEGQLNLLLTASGNVFIDYADSLLRDWQIEKRWEVFGQDTAREVVSTIKKDSCTDPAYWFYINLSFFRFRASFITLQQMWRYPYFWFQVLVLPIKEPRMVFVQPIRSMLKIVIKGIFKRFSSLSSLSPSLARLYNRVNR